MTKKSSVLFNKLAKTAFLGSFLTLSLGIGSVGAQYTFDSKNFAEPFPTETVCDECIGEIFLRFGEPGSSDPALEVIDYPFVGGDGLPTGETEPRAAVDIYARLGELDSDAPNSDSLYLGIFGFDITAGGPDSIDLTFKRCNFDLAFDDYFVSGLTTDETRNPIVASPSVQPNQLSLLPAVGSRQLLSTEAYIELGRFTCPLALPPDGGEIPNPNGYVFAAGLPTEMTLNTASNEYIPLMLRAENSLAYYPLDGSAPFEVATADPVDSAEVTVSVTNNVGTTGTVTYNFEGCTGPEPTVTGTELVANTASEITITFSESQIDNDCRGSFSVAVPGNSYSLPPQSFGSAGDPATGDDVRSTVSLVLEIPASSGGPPDPVQVVDLSVEDPGYRAFAYVRTNSGPALDVSAAISVNILGGVASIGTPVEDTVEFPARDKSIDLTDALNDALDVARGNGDSVQLLTIEVTVEGTVEPWSRSYLVVSRPGVASALGTYRTDLNSVIASTEGIEGTEVDSGLYLASLLSTGANVVNNPDVIQGVLNDAVTTRINNLESGFSSSTQNAVLTDAYTFSGSLVQGVMEASFVIDLGSAPTSPMRLAKQVRGGGDRWQPVVNGDGGSVHYSTRRPSVFPGARDVCPGAGAGSDSWSSADDGVVPAGNDCIRITIVDNGIYDVDGSVDPGLDGFVSDPIIGVADSPDIIEPGGGGGGGGSDSTGWIVALAALGGLLFAGSAGLWMIFALLAVLALSLWRRRSEVVVHHRGEL